MSGAMDIVVAGGVESMSRVPQGLPSIPGTGGDVAIPRSPAVDQRFGGDGFNQFLGAEIIAERHELSREAMDAYALESHRRAAAASNSRDFAAEIVGVPIDDSGAMHIVDEGIRFDANLDRITAVKPILPDGRLSAASASQVCDGASGILVMNESGLKRTGLAPTAQIRQMTVTAGDPVVMLEEPLFATDKALKRAGLTIRDIDLYECNEAFACVPLAWARHVGADPARMNVNGGGIALGHPLGSSGTRLMTTLVHALQARGARYGLQTMCEGGGLANVTIVERV
jgi:acetyl-CoA C-acetyltransferase